MIKHLVRLVITGLMASSLLAQAADIPVSPSAAVNAKTTTKSTTDHSKLDALKGPFKTGPEVTKACLSCHNTAGHQVMKSIHWTWEAISPTTGNLYVTADQGDLWHVVAQHLPPIYSVRYA